VYAVIIGGIESMPLEIFGIIVTPWFYRLGALARMREKAIPK